MNLNDGDLDHCWERMKRGFSLAQVAAGRDLRPAELDAMIWEWRARQTCSVPTVPVSKPWVPGGLRAEKLWLRDGSWGDAVAALD